MRATLIVVLAAACASEPAARSDPAPTSPTIHLTRRAPLGGVARSVLKKRMARHGNDMEALLAAVLGLDYDATVAIGTRIADEPRLTRPGPNSDTANALFPETFFVFQDKLHEQAAQLVQAARSRDDGAVAESFGRLTATCVGCHGVYMRMPGEVPAR